MAEDGELTDTEYLDAIIMVQDPMVRRLLLHERAVHTDLDRRLKKEHEDLNKKIDDVDEAMDKRVGALETIVFVIKKTFSFISIKYAAILTSGGALLAWLIK